MKKSVRFLLPFFLLFLVSCAPAQPQHPPQDEKTVLTIAYMADLYEGFADTLKQEIAPLFDDVELVLHPLQGETLNKEFKIEVFDNGMPDLVISTDGQNIASYARMNCFLNLSDAMLKANAPYLCSRHSEAPAQYKIPLTRNVNRYGLCITYQNTNRQYILAVNSQDLAGVEGITMQNYATVLSNAYTALSTATSEPDKLPTLYTATGRDNLLDSLLPFFYSYHINPLACYLDENGTIQWGIESPRCMEGLAAIKQLYKQGMLSNTFIHETARSVERKFQAGQLLTCPIRFRTDAERNTFLTKHPQTIFLKNPDAGEEVTYFCFHTNLSKEPEKCSHALRIADEIAKRYFAKYPASKGPISAQDLTWTLNTVPIIMLENMRTFCEDAFVKMILSDHPIETEYQAFLKEWEAQRPAITEQIATLVHG